MFFLIILTLYKLLLQDVYKTNVLKSIDKIEQLCYNIAIKARKEIELFDKVRILIRFIFLPHVSNKCLQMMDNYYNEDRISDMDYTSVPLARCAHCGKGIYGPDEAMIINTNKNTIHIDCWEDYAAENYEEFLSEFYG